MCVVLFPCLARCECGGAATHVNLSPVHTGENYVFFVLQEYLRKDELVAKTHRAVETL